MKRCYLPLLTFFICLLSMTSCLKIYGIKKHHYVDAAEVARKDARHHRQTNYIFDTSTIKAIYALPLSKHVQKDLTQPLQFWVITDNTVLCNIVNCYAKGFPNLKWHLDDLYNKREVNSQIDTRGAVSQVAHVFQLGNPTDTTIVTTYAYVMGRQSKRFLRASRHFARMHPHMKQVVINMDNTFK